MSKEDSPEFYLHSAREVTELLEGGAHETIWRTSFRIFEILQARHPEIAKNNPFLREFQRFIIPLVGVTAQMYFQRSQLSQIVAGGERYEEGEEHPIFYNDTIAYGANKKVGLFLELSIYELLDAGWNLDDTLLILKQEYRDDTLMLRESYYSESYSASMLSYYRLHKNDDKNIQSSPKVLTAH